MILYVSCTNNFCCRKIVLASNAKTRLELSNAWGVVFNINCPHCNCSNQFHVNNVFAESSEIRGHIPKTAKGALIGGLIGIIGGPLGIILGVIGGGGVGGVVSNSSEQSAVMRFNNYRV